MRFLALAVVLCVGSCWVTPQELQDKIDEFEPTETGDTSDTGF